MDQAVSREANLIDRIAAQYAARKERLPGAGIPWLAGWRERAMASFAAHGLPTPKEEVWKYTNLNPLAKLALVPAEPTTNGLAARNLPWLLPDNAAAHRLVFVDGWLRPDLCSLGNLPGGASITNLAGLLEHDPASLEGRLGVLGTLEEQPLLALNAALLSDGFVLQLGRDVVVDDPIELLFITTASAEPKLSSPRNLVLAEAGSRAILVERHVGLGEEVAHLANGATEIVLKEGASLLHCRLVEPAARAFHLWSLKAELGPLANYESFVVATHGKLMRNEVAVALAGRGASCRLNGAYMGRSRQHIDNTTAVDHACPETTSRQLYKGVLDGYARGVFQGRVLVRPGAQKTDGQQTSRALLLSEAAEIDTKPELEIYADDVKCSHGAAAGELDPDAMFYLRSRGIPESVARRLLVEAFLLDVVDEIGSETIRPCFQRIAADWIAESGD